MYLYLAAWVLHVCKQWSVVYLGKEHRGIYLEFMVFTVWLMSPEILKLQ